MGRVTAPELIDRKWETDIFVDCNEVVEVLAEEKIEGNDAFEAKTGMSREVLWHLEKGKSRYMPFDKADWILTKTGCVAVVARLTVYTRKKNRDNVFVYTAE